jgi:alkanesulfonate monooxygenase SsuD/methylene tetrahydromethanopterin reductase-like flavin-dependent oxidoreductase (luciferase family)
VSDSGAVALSGFGVHVGLQRTTLSEIQTLWRRVEALGFDWISGGDHFYAASGGAVCFEAVASHAALAATTSRVRCGCLVYSVGFRHPAVLANAIATIDHLSAGRVTLALGAGWLRDEYDPYGIPFPPAAVRLRQLEEAIQCIRGLLREEVTSFRGEHFHLHDARCEPKPLQDRLPIWIGGWGERVTLRLVAQHADGWNVAFVSPDDFRRKAALLDQYCERYGRDPRAVTRSVTVGLDWGAEDFASRLQGIGDLVDVSVLGGSTQQVVDAVAAYRDAGADLVILSVQAPFNLSAIQRFAAEVAPACRPREPAQMGTPAPPLCETPDSGGRAALVRGDEPAPGSAGIGHPLG